MLGMKIFFKYLKEFLDSMHLAQSFSEEGDFGGIWIAVLHTKPDKLFKGDSVIHLEFKLVIPQIESC